MDVVHHVIEQGQHGFAQIFVMLLRHLVDRYRHDRAAGHCGIDQSFAMHRSTDAGNQFTQAIEVAPIWFREIIHPIRMMISTHSNNENGIL